MTTVIVGFLHRSDSIVPQFRRSLTMLYMRDTARLAQKQAPWILGEFDQESSANIAGTRCAIVRDFLKHPKKPEWLLMFDSDATFGDDILDRLIEVADPVERPIIGGLAFGVRPLNIGGVDYMNAELASPLKLFPTIYTLDDDGKMRHWQSYPQDKLVPVDSTGAHCLLVHRSVLEDPRWLEDGHPQPWFRETVRFNEMCSEDHFFCLRAREFGYPVHIHTGAKTGHVKTFIADEALYMASRVVPPATERVTVIVPVLGRPQNAEPFMASLRASTGLADVIAVCSEKEDRYPWELHGAQVLWCEEPSFASKVNAVMQMHTTHEPWLFICGDDVIFRPGWLDHAQHVARLERADVIGVNDLANPIIMAGEAANHFLIRRSYIEEQGASWDGPGIVCHEGYHHWFIDNEIVTVAKRRGVWAAARGAVVEHMHPYYGKGPMDATYELGAKHRETDARHYQSRVAKYAARR